MPRKARPEEAETLWHVRNEAMRHGCKICYDAEVIARWTSEKMPEHYRTSRSISCYRPAMQELNCSQMELRFTKFNSLFTFAYINTLSLH